MNGMEAKMKNGVDEGVQNHVQNLLFLVECYED